MAFLNINDLCAYITTPSLCPSFPFFFLLSVCVFFLHCWLNSFNVFWKQTRRWKLNCNWFVFHRNILIKFVRSLFFSIAFPLHILFYFWYTWKTEDSCSQMTNMMLIFAVSFDSLINFMSLQMFPIKNHFNINWQRETVKGEINQCEANRRKKQQR